MVFAGFCGRVPVCVVAVVVNVSVGTQSTGARTTLPCEMSVARSPP